MNVTSTLTYTEGLVDRAVLFFAAGLILMLFSVKAAYAAHLVNEDAAVVLGVVLIAAGVFRSIPAYLQAEGRIGTSLALLGIPALAAGLSLILTPHLTYATYTGVVAVYLATNAILALGYVHLLKPDGQLRYIATSIATLAMALAVLNHWPVVGVWGVSLALGGSLLIDGLLIISEGSLCLKKARSTRQVMAELIDGTKKEVAS
jgi:uncharacterized membrane protein HdeD (DUF308 family)